MLKMGDVVKVVSKDRLDGSRDFITEIIDKSFKNNVIVHLTESSYLPFIGGDFAFSEDELIRNTYTTLKDWE